VNDISQIMRQLSLDKRSAVLFKIVLDRLEHNIKDNLAGVILILYGLFNLLQSSIV